MTKYYYIELARYNVWANQIMATWLTSLNEDQWYQELVSSFPSIKETSLHILSAENIWYQRLTNVENTTWLANSFEANTKQLLEQWEEASKKLMTFCESINEENLIKNYTFKRLNGKVNEMKLYEMLTHVFNHSTYHRGQLVNMLRQVGFTNVGSTDILTFYRTKDNT